MAERPYSMVAGRKLVYLLFTKENERKWGREYERNSAVQAPQESFVASGFASVRRTHRLGTAVGAAVRR